MTPPPESFGPCLENAGFLFVHDCPRRAQRHCTSCQKPICTEHGHDFPGGVRCTTCAREHLQSPAGAAQLRDPPRAGALQALLFSSYYYRGHGEYGRGAWGHEFLGDPHDFTEADGEALRKTAPPRRFEEDMEGS